MITTFYQGEKRNKITLSLLLLLTIMFIIITSACSNKEIITKTGASILPGTCKNCHGSVTAYPVPGSRAGYDISGHKNLGNSYYANSDVCQKCHTNEGFIKYVTSGSIDPGSSITYPSQIGCYTCHTPHETGDLSLRTELSIVVSSGKVFDYGKGNLCAHCHQALGSGKDIVQEMPANKVMPYWGAHHGPQADMITGSGAYPYEGKSYSNSIHSRIVQDGCITCHMELPEGRYGLSAAIGGHSFNMEGDVHHSPVLNTAGCLTCHQDIKQKVIQVNGKRKAVFTIDANADYDQNGTLETIQEEVIGLLGKMVNPYGTGYLQKLNPPFYDETGNFVFAGTDTRRTITEMAALFNYKFVLEDRSYGLHNITYTVQVLYDTIASLDTDFDVSMRPE